MFEVTKDTVISDIMMNAPDCVPLFQEIGMHCMGCPVSQMETLEMGCAVHGMNADELVDRLNQYLAARA